MPIYIPSAISTKHIGCAAFGWSETASSQQQLKHWNVGLFGNYSHLTHGLSRLTFLAYSQWRTWFRDSKDRSAEQLKNRKSFRENNTLHTRGSLCG